MMLTRFSRARVPAPWQEALQRWLQWNEAYEELTARMFQAKDDLERLEALADQLDGVRQEAVAASRALLRCGH